ncbi:hypothetical protein ACHAWT_007611, partial [Skeletonema menzelii]
WLNLRFRLPRADSFGQTPLTLEWSCECRSKHKTMIMKVKTTLLILLPAAAADSQSVNQARSENPNLRGGGVVHKKQSHRHEGHSLLEEFREQRAHKKDIENDTAEDVAEVADAGEQIVGPGKYVEHDDNVEEKSLARNSKEHPAVFRTSRLSRGEMEQRAYEMETMLQQVEEGTLKLYAAAQASCEIYLINHPKKKEAENGNTTSNGDAVDEKKKSRSAYSSGKAEYEKTIEQMKEKKEIDVLMQKGKEMSGESVAKVMEVGEEQVTSTGKKSEYVYGVDGSKQLRIVDDDEINQLNQPDGSVSKGGEDDGTAGKASEEENIASKGGEDKFDAVSEGKNSDDDDDIPLNFEGFNEEKMTSKTAEKTPKEDIVVSEENSAATEDDDIPPNFETLGSKEPKEKVAMTSRRGNDEIPSDIVENSLEKVKKLADVVSTPDEVPKETDEVVKTAQSDENDDSEETPLPERKADTASLKDVSEDAGTEEIDKTLLPKTSEGLKSSEREMDADGEER